MRSGSREWWGGSSPAVNWGPELPGGGGHGHWLRGGGGGAPASGCGLGQTREGRRPAWEALAVQLRSILAMAAAPLKVCIVGSGNWGSAVAKIIGNNVKQLKKFASTVKMWVFEETVNGRKLTDIINNDHENVKYLPGHKLPENVVRLCNEKYIWLILEAIVY